MDKKAPTYQNAPKKQQESRAQNECTHGNVVYPAHWQSPEPKNICPCQWAWAPRADPRLKQLVEGSWASWTFCLRASCNAMHVAPHDLCKKDSPSVLISHVWREGASTEKLLTSKSALQQVCLYGCALRASYKTIGLQQVAFQLVIWPMRVNLPQERTAKSKRHNGKN